MSNDFSPRSRYLKTHKEQAVEWLAMANSPVFQNAATHAFAEMAFGGATKEELKGARDFLAKLIEVAQPIAEREPMRRTALAQTSRHDGPLEEKE